MATLHGPFVPHLCAIIFAYVMMMICCPSTQVTLSRHREVTGHTTQAGGVRSDGHLTRVPGQEAPMIKRTSGILERHYPGHNPGHHHGHHPFPNKGHNAHSRHHQHLSGNDVPSGTEVGPDVATEVGSGIGGGEGTGELHQPAPGYPTPKGQTGQLQGTRGPDASGNERETGIPRMTVPEDRAEGRENTRGGGGDGAVGGDGASEREPFEDTADRRHRGEGEEEKVGNTMEDAFNSITLPSESEGGVAGFEGSYPSSLGSSVGDPQKTCEKCEKARQEDLLAAYDPNALVQLRIETIKRLILDKLRMEQPPQINVSSVNIPAPLSEGMFIDEVDGHERVQNHVKHLMPGEVYDAEEDYYGKTTRVIVAAKDDLPPCPATTIPSTCFEFNISSVVRSKIATAELWLYWNGADSTMANHTLSLSQQTKHALRPHRTIATQSVPSSQPAGWLAIDIKHAVRRWRSHSYHDQVVRVECPTCEPNAILPFASHSRYRPFIVIRVTDEPKTRRRRNVNCGANTTGCCRQDFHLRFLDIGWDWIISPRGFDANYCRGSCADFNSPALTHTSIIQTLRSSSPDVNIPRPCCSPRTSGPVSMIYMDDQGKFLTADLPNMSILSCGCS